MTNAPWRGGGSIRTRGRQRAKRPREPHQVMEEFAEFARGKKKTRRARPVLVAFPAAYDGMWVTWYLHRFAGHDSFRRRCIDLKTLAMTVLGAGYANAAKDGMPGHLLGERRHTHVGLDDAIEQRDIFVRIVRVMREERARQLEGQR